MFCEVLVVVFGGASTYTIGPNGYLHVLLRYLDVLHVLDVVAGEL